MINTIENLTNELNEQQKTAVLNPVQSCTKIVAGAGTGKTKIISKRFTKLALELQKENVENPQNKILVITFTDKAAGEMKHRILSELHENGISENTQDLWISTFHSFCNRLLKKHSIESGLSPSFKLGEEKTLQAVYDNILKRIKYDESDQISNLKEITENLGVESDILCVKSVNKLNVISDVEKILDEIFYVIKKIKSLGLSPKEFYEKTLLATKKFSRTLENTPFKFDSKEEYTNAWVSNYREYTDDYCVFDTNIFDLIAKEKIILDKFGKRKASEYGYAQGFPENLPEIEKLEIHLVKVIATIYAVYQNELEIADMVDFDDLINKSIEIFKNNELVRTYYQNYFKHIIIDEFQDTNGAQLELIELLMNPKHPNITYVGDRKQSIYGFRHAQMENLEVLHANAQNKYSLVFEPINLSLNYRSTKDVLNAVNYVTENELGLCDEKLTAGLSHSCVPKNVCSTVLSDFDSAYEHKVAEAKYIADEILNLKTRDNTDFKDFAILVKSHSQADLIEKYLRKKNIPAIKKVNTGFFNDHVIKNTIALLRLTKNTIDEIAYVRILGANFSQAQIYEFKKILDEKILEKILTTGSFDELKKMNFCEKFIFANENDILQSTEIVEFSKYLYKTIYETRKSSDNILQSFYKLINAVSPLWEDKQNTVDDFEKYKAENDLAVFEKILADFMQSDGYVSINTFLDYIEKIKEDRTFELPSVSAKEVDAVQILTIHASKGLEFPYIFVTSITSASKNADKSIMTFDMQYGDRPGFGVILNKFKEKTSPKSVIYKTLWKKPRDMNEDLRLFYVAVSRAKRYLNVLNFEPYGNNGSIKPAVYIQNLNEFLDGNEEIFG